MKLRDEGIFLQERALTYATLIYMRIGYIN